MAEKNRIGLWLPAAFVVSILLVIGAVIHRIMPGVYITVVDHGPEALHAVTIELTEQKYAMGDLDPGRSMRRKVSARRGSHAQIEFVDERGKQVHLDVGGYIDRFSRGEIVVEIRDGKIESQRLDVKMSIY
jgi:hypothetical protein